MRTTTAILVLSLGLPGMAFAASPEKDAAGQPAPLELSLDDAIQQALENNLSVQISRLARQSSTFALSAARRVYTPNLVLDTNLQESLSPAESQLDGASQNERDNLNYNLRFEQQLPSAPTTRSSSTTTGWPRTASSSPSTRATAARSTPRSRSRCSRTSAPTRSGARS